MDKFVVRKSGQSGPGASSSSSCQIQPPSDLDGDCPAQPRVTTPKTLFGSSNRSFRVNWYQGRTWLEYSVQKDACFCYACRISLHPNDKDLTFTVTGFRNWKTATASGKGFSKHSECKSHLTAMTLWADKTKHVTANKTIADSLCYETIGRNRYYLSRIIDVIKVLAVNELPFRGDKEEIGTLNSGMFLKLVEYSFGMDEKFKEISDSLPQNAKHTSPSFQNEIISILASQVHENIVQKIKSSDTGLFTIKCDETRDKCGIELLTVVIRFVNSQGIPEEKLLGMFELTKFDAAFITQQILGAVKDLDLSYLLAQAYDGASVMSGKVGGVQAKLCEAIGRDIPYVHCFNHQLHLVVVHVCEKVTAIQEFFDTSKLLCNFLSKSKVTSTYKNSGATSMARLMNQRWIGHYKTTKSILDNYDNIVSVLTEFSNGSDAELSVTAIGLLAKIQKERFYFCAQVMISLLGLLKPADKMLQSKSTSLVTGYQLVITTISELNKLRNEDKFEEIMSKVHEKHLSPEVQKRQRKTPARLDSFVITEATGFHSEDEPFLSIYYDILDNIAFECDKRFSELNSSTVKSMCNMIPNSEDFLEMESLKPFSALVVKTAIGQSFDVDFLSHEVKVAKSMVLSKLLDTKENETQRNNLEQFLHWFREYKEAFPNLFRLLCEAVTIGASTATCEVTFSTVERILTPYRRCMGHERKCQLVLMAYEKEETSNLRIDDIIHEFKKHSRRLIV